MSEQEKDKVINFFVNNYIYVLWFAFNFYVTWFIMGGTYSIILLLFMYAVSIAVAFSPIGEYILRFINGIRILSTKKEIQYLTPIFEEVYNRAKERYSKLNPNIEICTIDTMNINAVAIGKKTIAVTKGAIDSLSEEELKGFIAHEIGHIYNGDTKAVLLSTIGNGIFSIFTLIAIKLVQLIEKAYNYYMGGSKKGLIGLVITLVRFILETGLLITVTLGQLILAINSRSNEYKADEFSYSIGYGNQLVEALYILNDMVMSDKGGLVDKLKASHPVIAKRIGALEKIIDKEEKQIDDTK